MVPIALAVTGVCVCVCEIPCLHWLSPLDLARYQKFLSGEQIHVPQYSAPRLQIRASIVGLPRAVLSARSALGYYLNVPAETTRSKIQVILPRQSVYPSLLFILPNARHHDH